MSTRAVLAIVVSLLSIGPYARAQERRVFVDAGAGATITGPDVHDNFGNGWNAGMGFTIPVSPSIGVRLDFQHVRVSDGTSTLDDLLTGRTLTVTARHFMDVGTAAIRFASPANGHRTRAYAVAGGGIYYRKVTLESPDAGRVSVCNPWWFVCPPGPAGLDEVTGRRNSVDPGVSVGGGVEIAVSARVSIFVEARYHYIFGPSFTDAQGTARKANGQYLPIEAGVRF